MEFQTDFICAWDFGDKDYPCVIISRMRADGTRLTVDVLDQLHTKSGICSIRQLLAEFGAMGRADDAD